MKRPDECAQQDRAHGNNQLSSAHESLSPDESLSMCAHCAAEGDPCDPHAGEKGESKEQALELMRDDAYHISDGFRMNDGAKCDNTYNEDLPPRTNRGI